MTELNCPHCDAPNPSQSKFCNRCGAPLGNDDSHVCPTCGTSNPLTLLYCDHCGTRLIDDTLPPAADEDDDEDDDSARSEPFSLPTRPPGQTGNLDVSSELPDWLKTGEFSTGSEEAQGEPEAEEPQWLRAAHEGQEWEDENAPTLEELSDDHSPQDDLPTWLMDEASADEIFSGEKSTDELFMASLSPDDDDAPRETGSVLRDDLPDWLQGLSAADDETMFDETGEESPTTSEPDPTEADQTTSSPEPQQQDDPISELHGWLLDMEASDVESDESESSEAVAPTPKASDEDQPPSKPLPQLDEDDFLNWLSEIQVDTSDFSSETFDESATDPLQHTGLPDWPEQSIHEDASAAEEELDFRSEPANAPEPDEDPVPDWRQELDDDADSERPIGTPESMAMESPGWLGEPTNAVPEEEVSEWRDVDEGPGEEDFPDFLSEVGGISEDSDDEAGQDWLDEDAEGSDILFDNDDVDRDMPSEGVPEDEFLQWLDSLDDTSSDEAEGGVEALPPEITNEEPRLSLTEDAGDETAQADLALPDWLGELETVDVTSPDSDLADIDKLPDWLQDLAPPGEEVTLPYVSGAKEETDAGEPALEEGDFVDESAEVRSGERDEVLSAALEDDKILPDWLDGVTAELDDAEEPAAEMALSRPDEEEREESFDLAGAVADEPESAAFEPLDLDDRMVRSEDLPDWFSDVLADVEPEEEEEEPGALPPELTNVPEQLAGTELPQWLDSPFSDEGIAEPTPIEEIPEWLRAPLRERLARAAQERGLDETALESGDEWRELLESTPSETNKIAQEHSESAQAWLEALRTETASELPDDRRSRSTADDEDSPVAGIPGAIGIAPVVARAVRRETTAATAAGKEHEQQIMLLRQLARSGQEQSDLSVVRGAQSQSLTLSLRLVLSILLIVTVIIGRVASDLLPLPATDWAIEPSAAMQEVLGAAQGQPVLLVFDYTPAMAGALNASVEDTVSALEIQGSPVLLASQSAAGLALAQEVFNDRSQQVDDLGLIPGGSLGIRRLRGCLDLDALCQDLFGQTLAPDVTERLTDVTLIIVITADRDSLLGWVEQLNDIGAASLGAIVTPALEPVAGPYVASGQLAALGVAMGSSAGNGSLWNTVTGPALFYAHWLVLVAIVAGAVYYLVVGSLRSRRK